MTRLGRRFQKRANRRLELLGVPEIDGDTASYKVKTTLGSRYVFHAEPSEPVSVTIAPNKLSTTSSERFEELFVGAAALTTITVVGHCHSLSLKETT